VQAEQADAWQIHLRAFTLSFSVEQIKFVFTFSALLNLISLCTRITRILKIQAKSKLAADLYDCLKSSKSRDIVVRKDFELILKQNMKKVWERCSRPTTPLLKSSNASQE